MQRMGSVPVVRQTVDAMDSFPVRGPKIPYYSGRPSFAMLNANPFAFGVANLGWQAIVEYLIKKEMNVYITFADTIQRRDWLDTKVTDLDLIGLSVPFEDTYLNVFRMLESLDMPVLAKDRGEEWPVVVLGGMAMINPMPLEPIADVIILGEGRESLATMLSLRAATRRRGGRFSKKEFLEEVADIPGAYIPSHYRIEIDDDGYVSDFICNNGHPVIEANRVLDMTSDPITSVWTSSKACYGLNDYYSIMLAMGCKYKCPFCVVGHIQGMRSGDAVTADNDLVMELAEARRADYGTTFVKLFFSSAFLPKAPQDTADGIKELLLRLHQRGFSAQVGSLNVRQADEELFQLLRLVGQREVTFAPETVEELRPTVGKAYISDDKLHKLAKWSGKYEFDMNIYSLGALPGETDQDTIAFARLLRSLRRSLGSSERRLYVHFNQAFRKAQTPFQYLGNVRPSEARRKYRLLRDQLRTTEAIEFVSVIDDPMAYYQPVLALGDYNAFQVLRNLYKKSHVSEADWVRAFHDLGLSDKRYFITKDPTRRLPWEHISYVDHGKLKRRAKSIISREELAQ